MTFFLFSVKIFTVCPCRQLSLLYFWNQCMSYLLYFFNIFPTHLICYQFPCFNHYFHIKVLKVSYYWVTVPHMVLLPFKWSTAAAWAIYVLRPYCISANAPRHQSEISAPQQGRQNAVRAPHSFSGSFLYCSSTKWPFLIHSAVS